MPAFRADGFEIHDPTDHTKRLRDDLSGLTTAVRRTRKSLDLNGTVMLAGNDANPTAGGLVKLDLTGQTANITTSLLSSTPPAGVYEVELYLVVTTADVTAGTLTVTIGWTDNVGATSSTPITGLVLTATGRTTGRQLVRVASGDITYAVTVTGIFGASVYALYGRVSSRG